MCMNSLFSSDSSQCTIIHPTLILIKTLWFIHINTVFSPHIYCIRSYSKHLYEIKVMWVMIRVLCFEINQLWAFLKFPFCGGFSLYIGQIEVSTSPPGQPPGYLTFWKIIVQIPPTQTKMPFKCPTLGSIQVIKCLHPGEI